MKVLNIPGWKNSREGHWQTIWEASDPSVFSRIQQDNWQHPTKEHWVPIIAQAIQQAGQDVLVTAHSIGVTAFIHAVHEYELQVKGALLVTPSDPQHPDCPEELKNFQVIPNKKLPFHTILVASTNDTAIDFPKAVELAVDWQCTLQVLENAGHLTPKDGFGAWPEGKRLLKQFV